MPAQADQFAPALAERIVNKYGVTATFDIPAESGFDFVGGKRWSVDGDPPEVIVTPPLKWEKGLRADDTIPREAMVSYMLPQDDFEPAQGMKFTLHGTKWTIARLKVHRSGELIAAYEMWVTS